MTIFKYLAVKANQASGSEVLSFAAEPKDVLAFSEIERVSRDEKGGLRGFQRHQIASHIKEIRDYLGRADALLPNPIVIAFIEGVTVKHGQTGLAEIEIQVGDGKKPGFVVDGQQRLTALSGISKPGFQVFVSVLVCRDYNELRQQFVLINNTRPLPKALIYELLPNVQGLPERFTARSFAAKLVDLLNYEEESSLHGLIYQHTNPRGVIRDTAVQRLIMSSASDGAIRQLINETDYAEKSFELVSEFFWAVRTKFQRDWDGMNPKTSRLVHGAGIVAMGYVMELLHSRTGATKRAEFEHGLSLLEGKTAWTSGRWKFSDSDERPWNALQNTSGDIDLLSNFLVRVLKRELRRHVMGKDLLVANG
jgi:DGQHR domain-containing protein